MQSPVLTIVTTTLRWLLGGLFLWAGAVKLFDPRALARSIDAFGLVPEAFLAPLAIGLPLLEILAGLAVILRRRGGLTAMAGLLLIFLAALGYGIVQDLDIDCGCFSLAEQRAHTSLRDAFGRDLLLLAGTLSLGILARAGYPARPGRNRGRAALLQGKEENHDA